ncbi:MAG: hypothetical protein GXP10_10325 [Gammaproteobacteria bacterium]|nr:hypothetical protein [Gammaproteobacteria bacterium]
MKLKSRTFLLLMTLLYLPISFAENQFVKDISDFREVYLKATDGNARAVRKAIKGARVLESRHGKSPLVLAYKGGALALRGSNAAKRPLDRMRETEEGLVVLDRALRMLSKHKGGYLEAIETRLVAAFIFINLPDSRFHRLKAGDRLIEQLLAHPKLMQMPQSLQASIYFAAATSAEKRNNPAQSKHYLELTVKTDREGKNGKKAQMLLMNMTD